MAKNPLLELKVYLPGKGEPTRQVAFAKLPLLNLDGVHGHELPVKFWYHHGGLTPIPGARFLQTPAGKLYCRAVVGGVYEAAREVGEGERIPLGAEFSVSILRHLPRAREESTCRPLEVASGAAANAEAAALVEVTLGDERHAVWLKRNDEQDGVQWIDTSQGLFTLSFGYHQVPLGFRLQLDGFERRSNPGSVGDAAFASNVRVADAKGVLGPPQEISMNRPLTQGKYTLYQSSFQEIPGHREVSIFTAAYDPGRGLKYLGSLMVCGGVFLMFTMRSYMFKTVPLLVFRRRPVAANPTDETAGKVADPQAKAA